MRSLPITTQSLLHDNRSAIRELSSLYTPPKASFEFDGTSILVVIPNLRLAEVSPIVEAMIKSSALYPIDGVLAPPYTPRSHRGIIRYELGANTQAKPAKITFKLDDSGNSSPPPMVRTHMMNVRGNDKPPLEYE